MRKFSWLILLLTVVVLAGGKPVRGQASVYVEGTSDYLNGAPYSDFVYGGTAGVLLELTQVWHDRFVLSADVQENFALNTVAPGPATSHNSSNEIYSALTLGPRISFTRKFLGLSPYVQANVGFARYSDPVTHSSTDSMFGGQGGVTRRISPRFDAVLDYSYSYFGYKSGYYMPQSFSLGAVYHFVKR